MSDTLDPTDKATVLVVDDTPENLALMGGLLGDQYQIKVANRGERALKIAQTGTPDLILLDIMMPEMDGYEVCRRLKADKATRDIPIIFLTAKRGIDDEALGLELGAVDYITKPISPPVVQARVKTHLAMKRARDFLQNQAEFLESEVRRRTRELEVIQEITIHTLASLAETRDNETGKHIRRTQHYVKTLAERLRRHPRFIAFLDNDQTIQLLFRSAPLHDIGKVGIPDRILLKPGKLEVDEFEIMKTHTTLGHAAIVQAERELGLEIPFLHHAKEIARSHHEKWDGNGYPEGLAGDAIPISARLMAVADVYDALISDRVYKKGIPHEDAAQIIRAGRASHFDPDVADAFVELEPEFRAIAAQYADTEMDLNEKLERFKPG